MFKNYATINGPSQRGPLGEFSVKTEPYGSMRERLYLGMSQD